MAIYDPTLTMAASTYLDNKIIDHILRNTSYTPPASVWLGLCTSTPTRYYTGTPSVEISGSGYGRTQLSSFTISGSSANLDYMALFDPASANWTAISYYGIFNASSSGSLLYYGKINPPPAGQPTEPIYVETGDRFKVEPNDLIIKMETGFSTYLAGEMLDHVLNNNAYTSPGLNVFAALYTTLPDNDDVGGVEVSAGDYARLRISGSSWNAPSNGATYNLISLPFVDSAASDWGTVKGVCLRDAASGGNLLFKGSMNPYQIIYTGDSFSIDQSNLKVTAE